MDLPVSEPGPAKEGDGAGAPSPFECSNCDVEMVHKIAQLLLPGLSTACVDATAGDPFRAPSSVSVALRKDLLEFLSLRSLTFLADFAAAAAADPNAPQEPPETPAEAVADLLEDFAEAKRGVFARFSGWISADAREDKIDDFVQEMESKGFWLLDRREVVAAPLVRNLDFKNKHHCSSRFDTVDQLEEHKARCEYRLVGCANDGCNSKFSAANAEDHERACPYKVLPCEQKCEASVVRREMDRHCVTVCPMRLVNCPFYQVGCQSAFPHCTLERHCSEFLHSHLLCVLQVVHKHEASVDELQQRVQLLEKSQSLNELSEALDVRSLTLAVKEQEAKIKKLEKDLSKVKIGG